MKTVVTETVLLGREAFETLGEVVVVPDRNIRPEQLKDADALITRSQSKITPALLAGSAVRFVGTATAGFEHYDVPGLEKSGIGWCAAPGCNADSVADYMTAALLFLYKKHGIQLEGKTIGVIGVGQVGSRVAKRAEALGLRVLLNDPPRAAREGSDGFDDLEKLLAESDIVSLHVPLIKEKPWPTLHMADCRFFEQMKPGAVFINAARGAVLDTDALLQAKERGMISQAVLDVWDPEPCFRLDALKAVAVGTPHIAGHSFEGKLNGTVQVYREACRFFETAPVWNPAPLLPEPALPELKIDSRKKSDLDVLAEAVLAVYDIAADNAALRAAAAIDDAERAKNFDRLRAHYGVRREFKNTTVFLSENRPGLLKKINKAGFTLPSDCAQDNG